MIRSLVLWCFESPPFVMHLRPDHFGFSILRGRTSFWEWSSQRGFLLATCHRRSLPFLVSCLRWVLFFSISAQDQTQEWPLTFLKLLLSRQTHSGAFSHVARLLGETSFRKVLKKFYAGIETVRAQILELGEGGIQNRLFGDIYGCHLACPGPKIGAESDKSTCGPTTMASQKTVP